MTPRQLALVRETFDRLRPLPKDFGLSFYERLFRADPSSKALFRGNLENQAAMFATALTMSVSGLGEAGYVPASVRELGARHQEYGVPDAFYGVFGEALLGTLEEKLGGDFTSEVREAWAAAFEALSAAMKDAGAQARAAKEGKAEAPETKPPGR